MTEAERCAGQRLSVLHDACAVADLLVRLAGRDGVAATIDRAVSTRRYVLDQTYWMLRWTGPTFHVMLTPAGGGDPVIVEMVLPDVASELVLARSPDGKMTNRPDTLAEWLALRTRQVSPAARPGV